jgi:exoribonuclease R
VCRWLPSPLVPLPRVRAPSTAEFRAGFAAIRERLEIPEAVPPEVEAAGAEAARRAVAADRIDRRDIPFVTIDPVGSRDLDQALHIEARGEGHSVHYAIADVAAFVDPGDVVDQEAWRRIVTMYSPDHRAPLHPAALSEAAASLLPDGDRPAILWTIDLDEQSEVTDRRVERALIRSRAQLGYEEGQALADGGGHPALGELRAVGERRIARQADRGGISLHLPNQEVVARDGGYDVVFEAPLPIELWNEQISLLTGMVAAELMLSAGAGLLRTLPPPPDFVIRSLSRSARGLGVDWPKRTADYASILTGLDPARPAHAALITQSARLFRGAGYVGFAGSVPEVTEQAAIGAPYAHVTAPLRRLGDRFAIELALAAHDGRPPAGWAVDALDRLPEVLQEGARRQSALDRACVDFTEAMVLRDRVGQRFEVVVTDVEDDDARVQFRDPAVLAKAQGRGLEAGQEVEVEVLGAHPDEGRVDLRVVA